MTLVQIAHEKGPAGAEYAIGDDGAVLRTGAGNGTIKYEASAKRHGAYGLKFSNTAGANCLKRHTIPSTRTLSFRVALAADTTGTQVASVTTATDGVILRIEYRSATGYIAVTDAANAVYATSTNIADTPIGTIFDVAVNIVIDPTTATAGKLNVRRYDAAGNQVGVGVAVTNANLGTNPAALLNVGNISGGTARNVLIDDVQWDDGVATFLAPMTDPVAPPAVTYPRIAVIGDSKAFQSGNGVTDITAALVAKGWPSDRIRVSGVTSRVPYGEDVTPSVQTTWNGWVAEGFDPDYVVTILGGNIRTSSQNTWNAQFTALFNMLGTTRRIFTMNTAYKDVNEGKALNTWLAGFVAGKSNAVLLDHYGMIRDREAAGQTVSWNADGVHMPSTATGYGLINNLLSTAVDSYRTGAAPVIAALASRVVESFESLSITALASTAVTSWTWRVVSGPAVALTVSAGTVSLTTPAQHTDSTVVLGVKATNGAATSAEVTVTLTVPAHLTWFRTATALIASRSFYRRSDAIAAGLPSA